MTLSRSSFRRLVASPSRHRCPLWFAVLLLMTGVACADSEYPADAMVFVSAEVVDTILSAADDSEYQLPGLNGASLRVIRLRNNFAAHPGQLKGELEARLPRREQPLKFTATARLRTEADPQRPGLLLLRPEIVTLSPEFNGGMLDNALTMMAAATVRGALNTLANSMPALDLKLQRQIRLAQPASTQPIEFRIGGASVSADLQVPALTMPLRVSTRDLRFSQRGAFALLDIQPAALAPIALSLPAKDAADTAPAASPTPADTASTLDALVPQHTQTFVHIRGAALARLAAVYNSLPQQSRTLTLYSTWSHGKLFARKRLGLGCGVHGRLLNPGAVVGGLSLGALQARWRQQRLELQLPLWVEMETQARVNINGFPAPCGLTSPRPRCRCARGKTQFRVQSHLSEPVQLNGAITFSAAGGMAATAATASGAAENGVPASGIRYAIELTAPRTLALSPQVQLGRIGSLSVPARLPLPIGEVAHGELPLLLEQHGKLKLGIPPTVSRNYRLQLRTSRVSSDDSGLSAAFSLSLVFSR